MKVVFFGTPQVAADALEHLIQNGIDVVAVVSRPDRPKGRSATPVPTPVKEKAHALNPSLPVYQPEIASAPEFAATLELLQPDLFVVVAYGEIIKQHLLDMPRKACINLHFSLLPKYRGAAPVQHSILHGEKETGVTVMHMVKKMDAGDMIAHVNVPIHQETTFGELEQILNAAGKNLLLSVIRDFEAGVPPRVPQDHSLATLAPKIELENCQIDWKQPAGQLHNLVRGVNPHPGAWCLVEIKGEIKRLKINRTKIAPAQPGAPGTILNPSDTKGNIIVAAGDQALELLEIQLEGKKAMTSAELTRGLSRQLIHFLIKN